MSQEYPLMILLPALGDPRITNIIVWSLTINLRGNKNVDIYTSVNELTDDIQELCEKNDVKPYAEWDGDFQKVVQHLYIKIN